MLDGFEQALDLAESEMVRARVEKASICAYRAMIEAGRLGGQAECVALIDRYIELCRCYNLTHVNERDLLDPAQVEIRAMAIELELGVYEAYAGQYELVDAPQEVVQGLGNRIALSLEDERFLVESKQGKMQFHPETEMLFFAALDRNLTILLLKDERGQTTGLVITLLDGRRIRARRVT
jgi:hypothetical protein